MYVEYYNFQGLPFQLTSDHRFFFNNGPHKRAEAYLRFGLGQGEGFVVITGEIGAGKTTLVNYVLSKLTRTNKTTAQLVTSQLEAGSMLQMVAAAFGIPGTFDDKAGSLRAIEAFLRQNHEAGRQALLFVDECQNIPVAALEELRMLTNFQADDAGLLQVCLVGQPQFRETLASKELEQLRQRVITTYHLEALSEAETRDYIEHRLRTVGWSDDPSISDDAFAAIHLETGGVPRRINMLCNRILLYGFLEDTHRIDGALVADVVKELSREGLPAPSKEQPAEQEAAAPDLKEEPAAEAADEAPSAAQHAQSATISRVSDLQISRRLTAVEAMVKAQNEKLERLLKLIEGDNHKVG